MEFKKNDLVTVKIEDMGHDGEGIGKAEGYTLFIKDTVIGDVVEAKIMKMKKNYGYARLVRVLEASKDRTEPKCSVARACGGCQLQFLTYEKQLEFKKNKVVGNLERIGGFSDISVEKVMGMENPWRYRNKAQFPVGKDKEGNLITGFYAGRTHSIIPNTNCYLGVEVNEEILNAVLDYMRENHVEPYDEVTGKGLVRHILIRYGFKTKEIMVCIIINGRKIPNAAGLVEKLKDISGMTSITLNVNTKRNNVILGNEILSLWGKDYITDYIGEVKYQISPLSFYQVNPVQTEKLYGTALEYAGLTGKEIVWDLYCGIGTISLFLAQKAQKVYGVEIVPAAIEDARKNAELNGIENAEFFVGKAEEVLPAKYKEDGVYADVIVVDPPRKGCDGALIETMLSMKPERIVYVSCDSATLARDLKVLCEKEYQVEKVAVCDMFPGSVHVETVVLLSKGEVDSKKIRVEFSLEDMDMSEFQDGATYPQIKEYVLEHTGLKVSNLYISQIKRKCGIEVGKNYNLPKSEDSRQPQCPPEKEKAIREAFKYFGMI
ncbi:MAG: 23S rRNA (uracil(1939)-C(5))-methyltransferase RlmD [Blautia sp.]|nr:23S rRNA (uracil(1939)-C(5))-methyltransferase RlmD [Blautia sp.]